MAAGRLVKAFAKPSSNLPNKEFDFHRVLCPNNKHDCPMEILPMQLLARVSFLGYFHQLVTML